MFHSIRFKPFLLSLAIPLCLGFLSSLLSGDIAEKYESLTLPGFAPAPWAFGVVWPLLYLMVGTASYLVYDSPRTSERSRALVFYAVQLFLGFLWSPLFFGLGMRRAAFWLSGAVLVVALATAGFFARIRKSAFFLMLPYVLWLAFAMVLNRVIITLND